MVQIPNKGETMRRAFTLIELIFVIVILGILAAVAIPRLAGVQDDALVASEKSGIGSARTALAAIHGKALLKTGDFNVTVVGFNGNQGYVELKAERNASTGPGADTVSPQGYPDYISLNADPASAGAQVNTAQAAVKGTGLALGLLMDPDGRENYATEADDNKTKITGPASNTVAEDSGAEITMKDYWSYDPSSGSIVFINK